MNLKLFWKKAENKLFHTEERRYRAYFLKHRLTEKEAEAERAETFPFSPKISILVPIYRTPIPFLHSMIDSVVSQTYGNWELILANASPEAPALSEALSARAAADSRIVLFDLSDNGGISENTNRAFERATGDYIALFDHDDMLEPDALYCYVKALNREPYLDLLYCDEDKITEDDNAFFFPNFKPDFNRDMLYSNNYICHFLMVSRALFEKTGGPRKEFDGAQDYDFVLRCFELTDKAVHVPRILYHWRSHSASTAKSQNTKNYAHTAGERALKAHLDRAGIPAEVLPGAHAGWCTVNYLPKEPFSVTEVRIRKAPVKEMIAALQRAAENVETDAILLKAPEISALSPEKLSALSGALVWKDIGAVTPLILNPAGNVYHAGYHVRSDYSLLSYFVGLPATEPGYMCRLIQNANVSAASYECLLLRTEAAKAVLTEIREMEDAGTLDAYLRLMHEDFSTVLSMLLERLGLRILYYPAVQAATDGKKPAISKNSGENTDVTGVGYQDTAYNPNFSETACFEVRRA